MALPWGSIVLHRLILGKCEKIFLSKTRRRRLLIFGIKHHLVDLYQVQIIGLGPKMALSQGHMFYIGLYREDVKKIFLSETTKPRALIFGM